MPKKLPYLPLYTGDWKKDAKLSRCSTAARGVWIDLLCVMHDEDRSGELCGTADELGILARCSASEVVQALTELQAKGAAEVTKERNGMWRVCNRRMCKDAEKRKRNAERQMRHRNSSRDGPITPPITPLSESDIESAFEDFWEVFPKGRKGSQGIAREAFLKAIGKAEVAVIIEAATRYAASQIAATRWVKMPSTWLNQECWNDDPAAWIDRDAPAKEGGYRQVSRDEFAAFFRLQKFTDGPHRHATNPNCVYGTLRDGQKVECKDYPPKGTA